LDLVLTWIRDCVPVVLKNKPSATTPNGTAKNVQVGVAQSQDHGQEEGNRTAKKGDVSVAKIKTWIEERMDRSKEIELEREGTLRRLERRD